MLPQRGHPRSLPWAPQGRFSPKDILILFHFFLILGSPYKVFNPKMGLTRLMEVFTCPYFFSLFFSAPMRDEMELAPPSSMSY